GILKSLSIDRAKTAPIGVEGRLAQQANQLPHRPAAELHKFLRQGGRRQERVDIQTPADDLEQTGDARRVGLSVPLLPHAQLDVGKDHPTGENIAQNPPVVIRIDGYGIDGVASHLLKLRPVLEEKPFALVGWQAVELVENNQELVRLSRVAKRFGGGGQEYIGVASEAAKIGVKLLAGGNFGGGPGLRIGGEFRQQAGEKRDFRTHLGFNVYPCRKLNRFFSFFRN